MKALNTEKAPAAIGPYSQAIEVNGLVFTSGQLPIDPSTGQFPEGGIKEQTRQSLLNIKAILNSEGLDMGNVVTKETICEAVWGTSEFIDENALQVNLTRLKKTMSSLSMKLSIVPERGVGYRLMPSEETT